MPARKKTQELPEPKMASYASENPTRHVSKASSNAQYKTRTRRNKSATIERTDRFYNIDTGLVPFSRVGGNYNNRSNLDVRDAVILCQKAYYNVAIFRNTIDLMTEFSSTDIFFTGGSKKSREFFSALFKKINLYSFQDKFFREYYRSGNVFSYRMDGSAKDSDISKITQTFGLSKAGSVKIPLRYVILNPADIQIGGTLSFSTGKYYKVLSDYELARLKDPRTEEDKEVVRGLHPDIRKMINDPKKSTVLLPLDDEKITAVFYKKQDYEPFAVPLGYPVMEDINHKLEMRKMDMAVTRTMQQAILLVTMGTKPEDGGVNQRNLEAMQKLFDNESIGRVLIADYTTKAEFVIPDIASLLDPKKYAQITRDIQIGLNNILVSGDEKFSNVSIKMKVFVERLEQARKMFINEFLLPEVKSIAKNLGFKNYPTPHFEDVDLKDIDVLSRVYSRLTELGILTAEEGLEALQSGRLPTPEESLESQKEYKKHKNKGYYEPIIGAGGHPKNPNEVAPGTPPAGKPAAPSTPPQQGQQPQKDLPKPTGRPPGVRTPQSTKKITPIGANFSLTKIQDNMLLAQNVIPKIEKELRSLHGKKRLSNAQKEVAQDILGVIVANEEPEDWSDKVEEYCKKPVDKNLDRVRKVQDIAYEHQVDDYLASMLYASRTQE